MTALSFQPGSPHPSSPAEQCLHHAYTRGLLTGRWQFNQYRNGQYLDLVNDDARMVIEVDGYTYHRDQSAFTRDRVRDRALTRDGWTVHRFTSHEVLSRLTDVVREINDLTHRSQVTVAAREALTSPPPPPPTPTAPAFPGGESTTAPHNNPRWRVHRLVRHISTCLANCTSHTADAWAMRLNRALKRRYGPASKRNPDTHAAAYVFLTTWWAQFRVDHHIPDCGAPDLEAPACVVCQQYIPTASISVTASDGIVCHACLNYIAHGITTVPTGCHHCHTPVTVTALQEWTVTSNFQFVCPACSDDTMRCANNCDSRLPGHYTINGHGPALCAACMDHEYGDVTFGGGCDLECGTVASDVTVDGYWFRHFPPGEWTGDLATQPHHLWVCRHCLP